MSAIWDVVRRENAVVGILISMQTPSRPMKTEAASAGFYESKIWDAKYPNFHLLTINELLSGKKIEMSPIRQTGKTFK